MTAALAQEAMLPGRLREDGYELPANLPYERWLSIGETLQQMERSVQWWLGDWWNYGERHYGEMAAQATKDAVKDRTGYAYSTIQNAATVAAKFEKSRRRDNLSWSHHEAVARLQADDAEVVLDLAEEKHLSVYDTRVRVRELKEATGGRTVDATGVEVDTPELAWAPTIDDLTDDERTALEAHAPGGRLRQGYVAGWIRALLYHDQQDAFREWRGP